LASYPVDRSEKDVVSENTNDIVVIRIKSSLQSLTGRRTGLTDTVPSKPWRDTEPIRRRCRTGIFRSLRPFLFPFLQGVEIEGHNGLLLASRDTISGKRQGLCTYRQESRCWVFSSDFVSELIIHIAVSCRPIPHSSQANQLEKSRKLGNLQTHLANDVLATCLSR
jgi:hypothetical protein